MNKPLAKILAAAGALLLATTLASCTGNASQDEIAWKESESIPIVAIDSTANTFVSGHFSLLGGGEVSSKNIVDYTYARELKTGGLRQELVSQLYNEHTNSGYPYPGADAVTIFQDAKANGSDARIQVFTCNVPSNSFAVWKRCVMPDGKPMGDRWIRIDIHVPEGSVVQQYFDK